MAISSEMILSNDYADFIVPAYALSQEDFASRFRLMNGQLINQLYGMVHVQRTAQSDSFLNSVPYSSIPSLFTTLDTTSLEVSGIIKTQLQPALNLTGQGVLLGFLDTGINYTHPAFRNPDGTTRILKIWDQTIEGSSPDPEHFSYGSVYTAAQIDQALTLEDPYSLVPSRDTDGHGTSLAGAAAGSIAPAGEFSGAAPKAGILMVKLKPAKEYLRRFYFADSAAPIFQGNRSDDCHPVSHPHRPGNENAAYPLYRPWKQSGRSLRLYSP